MLGVKQQYDQFNILSSMGEVALASEFVLVPDDEPQMRILFKEFPVPIINPEDKVDVTLAGGQKTGTVQAPKTYFFGSCSLIDTVKGDSRKFIERLNLERTVDKRPKFSFTIYHGTPENHTQKFRCLDGHFFSFDPIATDTENATAVILQGQVAYHYFGNIGEE